MIHVDSRELQWREDLTIADILAETGDDSHYVVARIDEKYVSRSRFSTTTVPDGANVYFIHMVAGG